MHDRAVGQRGVKPRPGLAPVGRLVDIGPDVVELVPVNSNIRGIRIEMRWLDHADRAPLRHVVRRHIGPIAAVICCQVDQPVVAADPQKPCLDRRFGYRAQSLFYNRRERKDREHTAVFHALSWRQFRACT